ncbi:MAG: NeuD/PglB/VioB family sugar acetyltransferase [bacterium]|nr:NeuD/PglB/VioB family sugar acetyltransferase [bacterium]
MLNKKVIIVGAGEQGAVALNCLAYHKDMEFAGFLDDSISSDKNSKVLGKVDDHINFKDHYFHVAIGKNPARKKLFDILRKGGCKFVSLIHPRALIEAGVSIGENVFVGANAYINIGSSIGDNTIINNGCIVEHDNIVGSHCHLTPGVVTGGGVVIEDGVFVGLNSTIRDHIKIGQNNFIKMGSIIIGDIEDKNI